MRYLLDTNVCIAFLNSREAPLRRKFSAHQPDHLLLSCIVRAELLFGARKSARSSENLGALARFFSMFASVPFDERAAEHYGILRFLLEQEGTPIGANDLLIASTALAHELTVATRNRREFARVPGLHWEEW